MENERVILAIAKGRLMNDALNALKNGGINVSSFSNKSRELIFDLENYRIPVSYTHLTLPTKRIV